MGGGGGETVDRTKARFFFFGKRQGTQGRYLLGRQVGEKSLSSFFSDLPLFTEHFVLLSDVAFNISTLLDV